MFILMIAVFVLGYLAIALEHPIKIDKAATALTTGALCCGIYAVSPDDVLHYSKQDSVNAIAQSEQVPPWLKEYLSHETVSQSIDDHYGTVEEIFKNDKLSVPIHQFSAEETPKKNTSIY